MKSKALVILEGQYHPRFALEAASTVGLREFRALGQSPQIKKAIRN